MMSGELGGCTNMIGTKAVHFTWTQGAKTVEGRASAAEVKGLRGFAMQAKKTKGYVRGYRSRDYIYSMMVVMVVFLAVGCFSWSWWVACLVVTDSAGKRPGQLHSPHLDYI
jgi:hypothetical protein